ncbi:MAG: hypothetical protein Q9175_006281 [Cornicularia normoerica]
MSVINATPSATLTQIFAQVKKAAIDGKVGRCNVLGISLATPLSLTPSFFISVLRKVHLPVLAKQGYTPDEYLERDGARLRDWKEPKAFLKASLMLATAVGSWSQKINDAYEACFEFNIFNICGEKGPQKPIVPNYRLWVRFFEVENVKDSDIEKFAWN